MWDLSYNYSTVHVQHSLWRGRIAYTMEEGVRPPFDGLVEPSHTLACNPLLYYTTLFLLNK